MLMIYYHIFIIYNNLYTKTVKLPINLTKSTHFTINLSKPSILPLAEDVMKIHHLYSEEVILNI